MMTLLEAAEAAGVSKSTMRRAVKDGKVSATRNEAGAFLIDPSELFRVFPEAPATRSEVEPVEFHGGPVAAQLARLEAELAGALTRCRDLEADRDRWHAQAEQAQATTNRLLLTAPAHAGLFRRLFGKAA